MVHNFAGILWLQFVVHVTQLPMKKMIYRCFSTVRIIYAVPIMDNLVIILIIILIKSRVF
jgi:hypothetical protein